MKAIEEVYPAKKRHDSFLSFYLFLSLLLYLCYMPRYELSFVLVKW